MFGFTHTNRTRDGLNVGSGSILDGTAMLFFVKCIRNIITPTVVVDQTSLPSVGFQLRSHMTLAILSCSLCKSQWTAKTDDS